MTNQLPIFNKPYSINWSSWNVLWASLFTGVYVAITVLLHIIDLRTRYFDQGGLAYPLHHFLMMILGFYLGWFFYSVGNSIVKLFNRKNQPDKLHGLDRVIMCGFLGISAIQLLMIGLGFLGLLYTWLAIFSTSLFLFFSWPQLVSSGKQLLRIPNVRLCTSSHLIECFLFFLLCIILGYLFLAKVIFPSFDWDTIMHYDQYFMAVLRNHHIYPNSIWYHYFYSKGAGDFILGILLSDQDGHKLITYITLVYACMALWSLLSLCGSRIVSLTFIIIYLGIYVSNSWYIFDKQHVMMSCMILGLLWANMRYFFADDTVKPTLVYTSALMVTATILFVPTTVGLLLPVYGLLTMFYGWQKNRTDAIYNGILSLSAIVALTLLLTINYITTGMLEINPVEPFLRLSNQNRMSQWMSPYIVLWLVEGFPHKLTTFSFSIHMKAAEQWAMNLLHITEFHWLKPLRYMWLVFCGIYLARSKLFPFKNPYEHIKLICSIMLLLVVGFIMSSTMNQPVSVARFFIFTTPLLLLMFAVFVMIIIRLTIPPNKHLPIFLLFTGFVVINTFIIIRAEHQWRNAIYPFAIGKLTFENAYASHGLFSKDAAVARRYVGIDERIISSNPMHQSYAIPGRPMEVELNYSYRQWHTMVFDNPIKARFAYEMEGIKYFYFDFKYPISGMIPFSPLFTTSGILTHLQVVWHSKSAYLLTWRKVTNNTNINISNQNLQNSIEIKFAKRLSDKLRRSTSNRNLYERIKLYWMRNSGAAYPVERDLSLPNVEGIY